jgi:hypothetical protein
MMDRGRRELEHLVDDLAGRLQRSVVIDDPSIRLIYSSRHFGDEDEQRVRAVLQHDVGGAATAHILGCGVESWSAPGPIPAREDLGMARRWCAPLRWQGHFLGVLMVIDAHASLTAEQAADIETVGTDVAALLFRERSSGHDHRDREAAVADALSADRDRRQRGLRALRADDTFRAAGAVSVLSVAVDGPAGADTIRVEAVLRSILEIVTRNRGGRLIYTVQGTRAALLHTWPGTADHDAERRLAETVVERMSAVSPVDERVICGIGPPRDDLDCAWESLHDSEIAALAGTRVPRVGPVARYDRLGAYAVLMRLPDAELTVGILPPSLRALLTHDPNGTLTETLGAYLDHAGNSPRTAEALHIHRTSLYYRLSRIRELTGADLDDGVTRLALQLGLAVLPMLGER